jgi:hypothetical protein
MTEKATTTTMTAYSRVASGTPAVSRKPSRPFHGLGHVRMNRKDTTVFRSGVTLQNYEPVVGRGVGSEAEELRTEGAP